jgi:5-methylcytosine-specific restriction endonuclease McrA
MPSSAVNRRIAYHWYLGTEFWQAKREEALARANFLCQICRKPATEVHHLTYERVFNEMACDLLPVCSACHRTIHFRKPANDNSPGQLPLALPYPIDDNE